MLSVGLVFLLKLEIGSLTAAGSRIDPRTQNESILYLHRLQLEERLKEYDYAMTVSVQGMTGSPVGEKSSISGHDACLGLQHD